MTKTLLKTLISLTFALFTTACGSELKSPFAQNLSSRDWTPDQESPAERDYCAAVIPYSGEAITVSGQAGYQYRETVLTPGSEGLGGLAPSARAIRHAQYEVTNAAGTILQCGETDADGEFSFQVPAQERTLTLKIYSRSNNLFNRASVFIAPETNELHSLNYSFFASEDKLNVSIAAEGRRTVLGGAFFILDQIHIAFDRLKVLLATPHPGSTAIDDIPKADIYWEAGFDPSVYTSSTGGLSFFSRPQRKIFILGGDNGEVNFNDTDHFDPAIILHEYFHFLENTIGSTSSPGGAHSGDEVLDPRLAWSEGAAQFFQAAITDQPSVIDTRGNIDGVTGLLVKYGLENDSNDQATITGEGVYREFAIARFLWDMFDDEVIDAESEDAPEDSFDKLSDRFTDFWQATTNIGAAAGVNLENATFISMGLFLEALEDNGHIPIDDELDDSDIFDTTWKLLLDKERFTYTFPDPNNSFQGAYGIPTNFVGVGADTDFLLQAPFSAPAIDLSLTNPIRNINFHSMILNAGQTLVLNVGTNASATGGTLEFYVYRADYIGLNDFVAQGDAANPVSLEAGDYLVAVVVRSIFTTTGAMPPPAFVYSFTDFQIGALQ